MKRLHKYCIASFPEFCFSKIIGKSIMDRPIIAKAIRAMTNDIVMSPMIKKIGFSILVFSLLAACTPADQQYCQGFGVAGTAEFGKCMAYYHEQSALFGADRSQCEFEADATYPPTLYDYGHTEEVMGGFSRGVYYGGTTVFVRPDMRHNMEVDQLRMRIIEPCMQARGWNSGQTWQAGRHAVANMKPMPRSQFAPAPATLPWLK